MCYLLGRPCDQDGRFLLPGTHSTPRSTPSQDDWTPFTSWLDFETAEFFYKQSQMPAGQIDTILDLWVASLLPHGDTPPFANHKDLYDTIDSVRHGDVPWESFKLQYEGETPAVNAPSWMMDVHEIWYRDPRIVIQNMLANLDFAGEMDMAPLRNYNSDGERQYQNFMSGDWAWTQAVCYHHLYIYI